MKKCFLIIFLVFMLMLVYIPTNKAETKMGYLFLCETQKYADIIKSFTDIKSNDYDTKIMVWNEDKTPENIRNFLREQKIGEPESDPVVLPKWPELKFTMFIGEFPSGEMLKNSRMNPAYFEKNVAETDLFYCMLQDKKLDFDDANVRKFWNTKRDIYVGRILDLNDKILKNLIESQKVVFYNPQMFFGGPEWSFPWEETETKDGKGSSPAFVLHNMAESLQDRGFNKVVEAYQAEGSQYPSFSKTPYSNDNFRKYFYDSLFSVMLSSIDKEDKKYGPALWLSTTWKDLNHDKVVSKNGHVQNNELSTKIIANVEELENTPTIPGRMLVSLFSGNFRLTRGNGFLNEKWASVIMNYSTYFCSDVNNSDEGWQATLLYLVLDQIFKGKTVSEVVYDLPFEYAKLTKVGESGWASWEAWTTASLVVIGDPSYRPIDHFKPYSINVPDGIDMGYHRKSEFKVINLSDETKKVNINTDTGWIRIVEPQIILSPHEEKNIEIQTQIEIPGFIHILRLPINKWGEIEITVNGEKAQYVKVIAKM